MLIQNYKTKSQNDDIKSRSYKIKSQNYDFTK